MMDLRLLKLRISDIEEDLANNPRLEFEVQALEELADSIKKQGLLQPILVRHDPNRPGRYIIISGARRYKAIKYYLKLEDIDACITTSLEDEAERFIAQVQENEQRAQLNSEELKAAVLRLHTVYGLSNTAIAEKLGKRSANFVSRILSASKPGMSRFLAMCNGSTENLSEIAKFSMEEREHLQAHFEKSGRPYSQSDLRKIALMQRSGVEIAAMNIRDVIALTRDEIVRDAERRKGKLENNKNFLAGKPAVGRYASDIDSDLDIFEHELRSVLQEDKTEASSSQGQVEEAASSIGRAPTGKYAKDDPENNRIDVLSDTEALALHLDPKIELNVRLTFGRFAQALTLLKDDLHPDQVFDLPVNVPASRARKLISQLGGDASIDQANLAAELSRRLARLEVSDLLKVENEPLAQRELVATINLEAKPKKRYKPF